MYREMQRNVRKIHEIIIMIYSCRCYQQKCDHSYDIFEHLIIRIITDSQNPRISPWVPAGTINTTNIQRNLIIHNS